MSETATPTTLRVVQDESDRTLPAEELVKVEAGTYLGDGMRHTGNRWTWTRVRVIANDRQAGILVVRFPDGEYAVNEYAEADQLYVRWADVRLRTAELFTGQTWAA
jgi:hypothetical protein